MSNPEKQLEVIERQINELTLQIEDLEEELNRLKKSRNRIRRETYWGGRKKFNEIFEKLPIHIKRILSSIGVTNDNQLEKFLEGKIRQEDIVNKTVLFYYSYKISKTREERLQSLHGVGPKLTKETLRIYDALFKNKAPNF